MRPSRLKPGVEASDGAACARAALALLARREHSAHELARKLVARGFADDVVTATLAKLTRSGTLADVRFTESFVRSRVAKGQGPARIRAELATRGVAEDDAANALGGAEVDWFEKVRTVRRKRFGAALPRDYAERARQARFLQYRGFDSAQIRAALELDADSD